MNRTERRMLDVVCEGRDKFGFDALKAEFEAEGTRTDELLRLLEIARRGGVKVGLKIGGCEAVRDLCECKQFGVDYIIAPMIETPYALTKYIDAKNKVFKVEDREDVKFLFNVETLSTFEKIDEILEVAATPLGVDGIVFGRVDFAGSMGLDRSKIDGDAITDYVFAVARKARAHGLQMVTGGAVTKDAVSALRRVRGARLDRFETRKIIFDASLLDGDASDEALLLAIEFEHLWLINKREYYQSISREDHQRIAMLEARMASAAPRQWKRAVVA